MRPLLLALAALLTPASASANTDVVILLGYAPLEARSIETLATIERGLEGARIAVAHGENADVVFDLELGAGGGLVAALEQAQARRRQLKAQANGTKHWAPLSVDILDATLDAVKWAPGARRRVLLVDGGHALSKGRTTIEEVVFRAEREEVVIHALEFVGHLPGGFRHDRILVNTRADVARFLARPHATLGRVPVNARHATLQSGGSFHVAFVVGAGGDEAVRLWIERTNQKFDAATPATVMYGARNADGEDALDELASGRRRSYEFTKDELPAPLWGVDMEPLLDAVWDYVDARRVIMTYKAEIDRVRDPKKGAPRDIGEDVARALLAPRRLPPSRR